MVFRVSSVSATSATASDGVDGVECEMSCPLLAIQCPIFNVSIVQSALTSDWWVDVLGPTIRPLWFERHHDNVGCETKSVMTRNRIHPRTSDHSESSDLLKRRGANSNAPTGNCARLDAVGRHAYISCVWGNSCHSRESLPQNIFR
jgi:hypothetical protein